MAQHRSKLDVQAYAADIDDTRRVRVALIAGGTVRESMLRAALEADGRRILHEDLEPEEVLDALAGLAADVVVLDVPTGLGDDIAVIASIAAASEPTGVVVVLPRDHAELAVQALLAGATGVVWREACDGSLRNAVAAVARGEAAVPGAVTMALVQRLRDAEAG
ncbi:MAG: response regulator transcription factor [Solirubrobacteraceae bacterium]|nr:response regulator transcription factor [Solirubrobacteraceae bacterium]